MTDRPMTFTQYPNNFVHTDRNPMNESARFVALEREAMRLLDLAIDESDPAKELALIREARKLRALLAAQKG